MTPDSTLPGYESPEVTPAPSSRGAQTASRSWPPIHSLPVGVKHGPELNSTGREGPGQIQGNPKPLLLAMGRDNNREPPMPKPRRIFIDWDNIQPQLTGPRAD